ncbi:MAG: hypothetical protein COA69_06515 [Robiginitomaculum sp.]|nr:MAG: hypothetical protein COA69_06515 [Robiginitomaculum sp.]
MKFIIYSRDKQGALDIRTSNRDAHLAFLKQGGSVQSGPVDVLSAGPWLDAAAETMIGSLLIVETDTLETVHTWLKDDPYTQAGLPEHVNIHPFIWAIGAP